VIRQLLRLTRPVPAAGPRACAIAVYADAGNDTLIAQETGLEGVACVDDAARALVLACDLWRETRIDRLREWADGLLDFILYMQRDDGRFHNFIRDWDGKVNGHGRTSFAGGTFWQARAIRALAKAHLLFRDERVPGPLARGFTWVSEHPAPSDVRCIQVLAAIDLMRAGLTPVLRETLDAWCDEIASCRNGDVLLNSEGETEPHLWGHLQEGVLAEAGIILDRPELVDVARRSALAFVIPEIESGFARPTVLPYSVASAVYVTDRLHLATGEAAFATLRDHARAWFDGRNTAGAPVYDRVNGRVHDGIDAGRVNLHSGAESNIVAAQALLPEIVTRVADMLAATAQEQPA
jgi:hypothetical protein